jgi:hypothetical protein
MTVMTPSPDVPPNYHFLLFSPSLGAEWFFDAARAYFERFHPIVGNDLELARLIPPELTIIITVVTRRDLAAQWGVSVAQALPEALFDPLVFDSFDEMKAALNQRTQSNQPFGVPLLPTATPAFLLSPTPGPLIGGPPPSRTPGGFITQTPTPGGAPDAVSTPPAVSTPESPAEPIYPTPGPIIGG